jgi:hypothetical protein
VPLSDVKGNLQTQVIEVDLKLYGTIDGNARFFIRDKFLTVTITGVVYGINNQTRTIPLVLLPCVLFPL